METYLYTRVHGVRPLSPAYIIAVACNCMSLSGSDWACVHHYTWEAFGPACQRWTSWAYIQVPVKRKYVHARGLQDKQVAGPSAMRSAPSVDVRARPVHGPFARRKRAKWCVNGNSHRATANNLPTHTKQDRRGATEIFDAPQLYAWETATTREGFQRIGVCDLGMYNPP